MSFGLITKNLLGYFSIDETYTQYEVVSEGTVPYSGPGDGYGKFYIEFTYSNPPGTFIVVRNMSIHYMELGEYGGTVTGHIYNYSASGTLYYKVLSPLVTPSTTGYGLIVRNSSNQTVFDSNKVYLSAGIYFNVNYGISIHDGYKFIPSPFTVSLPYSATGYWMPLNATTHYLGYIFAEDYYRIDNISMAYSTETSYVSWVVPGDTGNPATTPVALDTQPLEFYPGVILFK